MSSLQSQSSAQAAKRKRPINRRTSYKNPEPREEGVVVPSWIKSNILAAGTASRPWTHAYISKSFNVGVGSSSSPSLSQFMFPPELPRQQQLAALKISNHPRFEQTDGGMGVAMNGSSRENDSASNRSDPASSAVTECRMLKEMNVVILTKRPGFSND